MTPSLPTAHPWLASGKETAVRYAVVPELCFVQVAPPSLVAEMVPFWSAAQPWLASRNKRAFPPYVFSRVQWAPPSLVARKAMPVHAQPWLVSGKVTEAGPGHGSASPTGSSLYGHWSRYCCAHVAPPSAVAKMTAEYLQSTESPLLMSIVMLSTQPWRASGKLTAEKDGHVRELCAVQVAPPSDVATMTPRPSVPDWSSPPTAHPWVASVNVTAWRDSPTPDLCSVHVAPPSTVAMMTDLNTPV